MNDAAELSEAVVQAKTAVACLAWLSAKYRMSATPQAANLARRLDDDRRMSISDFISVTTQFGFRGQYFCRDWDWLTLEAANIPVLLVLKNRNAVVAVGGNGESEIRISDPLYRDGELLALSRADFEHAWEGDAVTVTPQRADDKATFGRFPEVVEPLRQTEPPSKALPKRRRSLAISLSLSLCPVTLVSVAFMVTVGHKAEPTVDPADVSASAPQVHEHPLPTQPDETTTRPAAADPAISPEPAAQTAPPNDDMTDGRETAAADADAQPTVHGNELHAEMAYAANAVVPDASPPPTTAAVAPAASPPPLPEPDTMEGDPVAPAAASPADAAALVKRGDDCLRIADVSFARLFYRRAAEAGVPDGALKLAETFDPLFLERANLQGIAGDVEQATYWYRRARDLGSPEADVLLEHR